ncbi:MAG: hypothetical protein ABSC42_06755 [Tepidisphaeraceae bacterium]
MRKSRNFVLAAVAWVGMAASFVSAQVMNQVPSNALALLKVSNLQATSKKVADLATSLGLAQMSPDMADPVGSLLKQVGAPDGVNPSGDLAIAYIDPAAFNAPNDKSVLVLIPVADYQKFIGNFADAKPDGDLTQVHFKDDANVSYVAHWGDYAAASPVRDIVAKPPTDIIQVDGLAAKELDGKDIVFLGNLKALRPMMLQGIDKARQAASPEIDQLISQFVKMQNIDATKFAPLAKVIVTQCLNVAQAFSEGADAASYSINLSTDGVATTLMCQFDPASSAGKYVADIKNTDDSLLTGLADGKYLLFGGGSPQQMAPAISNFLAPIQAAITDLGPQYSSLNDWITALQKVAAVSGGSTFGLLMPSAQPGAGPLVQLVVIRHGDAKAILDASREMQDAQQAAIKAIGVQMPAGAAQTFTRDAKTVDGVSFDEVKAPINLNGQNPQQMQAMQFISMIYGPQGPDAFTGVVNDQNLLTVMGLDDAGISAAIAAAKAGDDPLAKIGAVKAVSSELPAQRCGAVYVPLDLWVTTGFGYAKMFGIDMGVTMPDNLPPMGSTLSTDASAVRLDTYLPSQLLQAMTAAGMQVYMKTQNHQPPNNGGNGGAAPGGM